MAPVSRPGGHEVKFAGTSRTIVLVLFPVIVLDLLRPEDTSGRRIVLVLFPVIVLDLLRPESPGPIKITITKPTAAAMSAKLTDLVATCDQRTRRAAFKDAPGACNGLQVANLGRVTKIGAAVDAGLVSFQKAIAAGVDFLIVHHGIYWDMPRPLTGAVYDRVATLIRGNCALYSSHLPLDGHPAIGNNALLARQLGLKRTRPFLFRDGEAIGCIADAPIPRATLRARLESHYPRVIAIECGAVTPRGVAFCSGAGNSAVPELAPAGVDTLVTGELREEWFNRAQEEKLNLYLCGHYATEVHAVQALAAGLARKFKLPWEFIATGNPL